MVALADILPVAYLLKSRPPSLGAVMQRYQNVSGNSGVIAFELQPNAIVVQFQDGWKYRYTAESAGASAVRDMRRCAMAGWGLSTLISQQVKGAYAEKFR